MKIDVMTLFPELIQAIMLTSITGRAHSEGIWNLQTWNIRDYADNSYGRIDDTLYGGGRGMLMQCEPVWRCWMDVLKQPDLTAELQGVSRPRTIFAGPKGRVFDQQLAKELSGEEHLIFLCGHYEGIDSRVLERMGAEELSLGDFVLTGGELAVSAMADAVLRMVPGVLPSEEAFQNESHYDGLLEARQYTKPSTWDGRDVPDVLLSGHHARIETARRRDALRETYLKRPDLLDRSDNLTAEDLIILAEIALETHEQP